jgi:type IV pilus assembly protein PilA
MASQRGFTLIEVMLIIAILGVLMASAIAAYQDYSVRAKVAEGVNLVAALKVAVSESLVSEGDFPSSNVDAGMVAPSGVAGRYVSATGTGAVDGGGDGLILIRFQGDPVIAAQTLEFSATTTAGALLWRCGTSNGVGTSLPRRYLPSGCRL